jgi:hypothetical protein
MVARRSKAKWSDAVVVGATLVEVTDVEERTAVVDVALPIDAVVESTTEEEVEVSVVGGAV